MRVAELRFLVRAFDAVIMLANCRLNDVLFWTVGSPLGWFSDALEPVTKPTPIGARLEVALRPHYRTLRDQNEAAGAAADGQPDDS